MILPSVASRKISIVTGVLRFRTMHHILSIDVK